MAKFNLDYYSGENFYSDGDIEKEILKIVKTQGSYESMENVPFRYFTIFPESARTS